MTRTYSDDEYADALDNLARRHRDRTHSHVLTVTQRAVLTKALLARAQHPNHVYPAVYAPGGYIGGAGTEGG